MPDADAHRAPRDKRVAVNYKPRNDWSTPVLQNFEFAIEVGSLLSWRAAMHRVLVPDKVPKFDAATAMLPSALQVRNFRYNAHEASGLSKQKTKIVKSSSGSLLPGATCANLGRLP